MAYILVLDIGGTFIKSSVAEKSTGELIAGTGYEVPTCADGTSDGFFNALRKTVDHARNSHSDLRGVSVCIPGPFDYTNGISLMEHKFSSIHGKSLTPFFMSMGLPVVYLHDSTAFLLGELRYGAALGYSSPLGIMLGTGFGFALASGGRICVSEDQRPSVRMWSKPYGDGIVEDYVSRRAIRALYKRRSGCDDDPDVKEIGTLADDGDIVAQSVFAEIGVHIGRIISTCIPVEAYDCLVLGGQISRSHHFIIPGILEAISCPVFPARHISDAALRGAVGYFLQGKAASVQTMTEAEALRLH